MTTSAAVLLEQDNLYGAAALLRQLVEAEYLAWAFAEDRVEAAAWLRSTNEKRREMWQPKHLRERSGGRFRAIDYAHHCECGGHPTPSAKRLLPGIASAIALSFGGSILPCMARACGATSSTLCPMWVRSSSPKVISAN